MWSGISTIRCGLVCCWKIREVSLRPEVPGILRALDERGILHSIASRNDRAIAMEKLREFGLAEYFLWPQINWNPKSDSIKGNSG